MPSVLTKEHLKQIKAALKQLDQADDIIKRGTAAGLDLEADAALAADQRAKLQGIRANFFPGE